MKHIIQKYESLLLEPIDGFNVSLFRLLFGIFLILDAFFFCALKSFYFPEQRFYFQFPIFEGWPHFGSTVTTYLLISLATAGLLITLGRHVRLCAAWAFLVLLHLLLRDAAMYMNHLVLSLLISGILILIPSDRYFFVGQKQSGFSRSIRRYEQIFLIAPFWISYIFGAIGKLRPEWFSGDLIAVNMGMSRTSNALSRLLYQPSHVSWEVWAVLFVEIAAPVGLLFRPTRRLTILSLLFFHIVNHFTMNIGLFSILMIDSLVLYASPETLKSIFYRKQNSSNRVVV